MVLNHRDRVINAFKSVHSGHPIIITVVLLFIGSAIFSTATELVFNPDKIYREKINTPVMDSRPAGDYSEIVKSVAIRHKVDPNLITTIIEIESKGNSRVVSPRGAKGLMQIMPLICKKYSVTDPFDMEQNIRAGTAHLAYLLQQLNGDVEQALAAYNCGLVRVIEYKGVPPFTETRNFVQRVVNHYKVIHFRTLPTQKSDFPYIKNQDILTDNGIISG